MAHICKGCFTNEGVDTKTTKSAVSMVKGKSVHCSARQMLIVFIVLIFIQPRVDAIKAIKGTGMQ